MSSAGQSIWLNGAVREVPVGATLVEVLGAVGVDPVRRGIAVALDGEVVPRSRWSQVTVSAGARVEVVGATQGG